MKTSRSRIAATVAKQTLAKGSGKAYARELAAYLLAEKRTGELEPLLRDVSADWANNGYIEVIARSAHPLSAASKAEIQSQVRALYPRAQEIQITEVADSEVLGGVQIHVANQQLDLSVEAKLNKFKQLVRAGKE